MNGYLNNMIKHEVIAMYTSWSNKGRSFCMHSFVKVFTNGDVYRGYLLNEWLFL